MVGVQALKNAHEGHRAHIFASLGEKRLVLHFTTEQLNSKKDYSNLVRALLNPNRALLYIPTKSVMYHKRNEENVKKNAEL